MSIHTKDLLANMNDMRRCIAQISKARSTWRKYLKTAKERNFTAEQIASAKQVLRESVAYSLAVLMERGMHISQMDEADIEPNSEVHADEIIS
jgi:hypothetical protein